MKLNIKTLAIIYSLNAPAEVTIIEMVGNNKYLAEYRGRICAAMFNPFSGTWFVDDVHGRVAQDFYNVEGDLQLELNYLFDAHQLELDAYKKIGTVHQFRHLREQEAKSRKRQETAKKIVHTILACAGVACCTWIFISGIMSIFA